MLNIDTEGLQAIANGAPITYTIVINFQQPETYTKNDYLLSNPQINTSVSEEGSYELSNITIALKNTNYYFSRYFYYELPIGKLVQIYYNIGNVVQIEAMRGKIDSWELTPTTVSLSLTA